MEPTSQPQVITPNFHVHTRTFWQLFTGGLILIPFILSSIHEVSRNEIPWLLAVGLFPGILAILFAVAELSRLPVAVFGDDDLSRASHSSDLWLDDAP